MIQSVNDIPIDSCPSDADAALVHLPFISGVTMVGVIRGSNWRCHPYFFLKKNWRPLLVITVAYI